MKIFTNKLGYTLAEITLVVAIIIMFSGVAIAAIAKSYGDYKDRAEVYANSGAFEAKAYDRINKNSTYGYDFDPNDPFQGFDTLVGEFKNVNASAKDFENSVDNIVDKTFGSDNCFWQVTEDKKAGTTTVIVSGNDTIVANTTESVMGFVFGSDGTFLYAGTGSAKIVADGNSLVTENGKIDNFESAAGTFNK